jgi:hypothetical protein
MHRETVPSSRRNRILAIMGCCCALGVAQYFLYSVNFHQFFQGDAIFWMSYRFHSTGEFFQALPTLDIAHWYRPLSNRVIPSLFYPFWGLRPYGYHLVVFACFFTVSCLVFAFLHYLTKRISVAFPAAFYFSIHSNNVYTTYDFAFAPELFYVFFYVSSVWLFIEGERRESWMWRLGSALSFLLSLMSKEAAVTLPVMLVMTYVVLIGNRGLLPLLRASGIQLLIWTTYLAYIVVHLKVGSGDYMLSIWNIPGNSMRAVAFAFNLRLAGWMPTRVAPAFVLVFLLSFALLLVVLAAASFRREKRLSVFALLWFVIALSPMLMLNAFGPYYLFLSMVGFSLLAGLSLSLVRGYACAAFLLMIWASCHSVIAKDTAGDLALGLASVWAENSTQDVRAARPQLKPGANIYILDQAVPDLWRFHGLGALFRLLYNDDSITTSYRSLGHSPKADAPEMVVMRAESNHLVDVTTEFRQDPAKALGGAEESSIQYVDQPGVSLSVAPAEVVAGRDFYWLSVSGWRLPEVVVQYTLNDGPIAEATFRLNSEGQIRFFVSTLTPTGVFRFLRFRASSAPPTEWIKAEATLRVVPPSP